MTATRLLLVSPVFHGYWRSVAEAFERRGYTVRTHLYDARSLSGRLRHKVAGELPERLGRPVDTRSRTAEAVRALRSRPTDALLVVKGDTLGTDFWEAAVSLERRALWLYDELRRTRHTADSLAAAGTIASYSPLDVATLVARGHRAAHVPLAYDGRIRVRPEPRDEVVFVGARYPNREEFLAALHARGVPVRAFGRDWSGHPADRLRTWRVRGTGVPSGRGLARARAYAVMAGASGTLNIHGDQDGFTMRTFEASGVGALQLVDRPDVALHYEPGTEVGVFASVDEAAELALRARCDSTWAGAVRAAARRRTLAEHTFDHRAAALERLWE